MVFGTYFGYEGMVDPIFPSTSVGDPLSRRGAEPSKTMQEKARKPTRGEHRYRQLRPNDKECEVQQGGRRGWRF